MKGSKFKARKEQVETDLAEKKQGSSALEAYLPGDTDVASDVLGGVAGLQNMLAGKLVGGGGSMARMMRKQCDACGS